MRPTLRSLLLMILGLPVSLGAVLVSEELWVVWFAFLAGAVVAIFTDAILALPRRKLEVEVEVPDTLFMGDEESSFSAFLHARRKSRAKIEVLAEVGELLRAPDPIEVQLTPGQVSRVEIPIAPLRRGNGQIKRLWLRWSGPFGLSTRHKVVEVEAVAAITPNIRAVRQAALRYFSRDSLLGIKIDKNKGDGSEFEALREYVPGMDHRAIDWKQSARHRRLVCKEFRAERNHPIVIAVDTGHLMTEPIEGVPRIDTAINAGLLLSYISLRVGDRVGLFAFDSRVRLYTEPGAGVQTFHRLQRVSAELEYRHDETNFTLGLANLASRLSRRSLIVLLTDFTDTVTAELMVENVSRLTSKHLVLFVSLRNPSLDKVANAQPHSFSDVARSVVASDFVRERDVVLERLRRMGVLSVDVAPALVSSQLINQYLHVKRREMI